MDALLEIAGTAPAIGYTAPPRPLAKFQGLRIGVAQDASFGFYYPDDLEAFSDLGAQIVPIDMMQCKELPAIDGLFIGGGFPEVKMAELSANLALRTDIRNAIAAGLPTYAECGGLMYLCNSLSWNGQSLPMCGIRR